MLLNCARRSFALLVSFLCCATISGRVFADGQQGAGRDNSATAQPAFPLRAFPSLHFALPSQVVAWPKPWRRLVVLEQFARVLWFDDQPYASQTHVALDLTKNVPVKGWMGGLLGFAFHPRFAQNHQVFLYWVGATCRLSRFTMDPAKGIIDPSSETVLLELPDPNGQHHGGQVEFGPDGFLYLSIGDLGPQHDPNGFAQAPDSLRGKMLRIDPDHPEAKLPYGIPAGNPFVGRTSPAGADLPERPWRPEIWALGLRNVYRFSFDRKTGALWGADVGQNTQEEIDIIERGANYGWNAREGTVAHPAGAGKDPPPPEPHVNHQPFTEPVFAYGRAEGVSITGGYVYQGKRFPWLKNKYVYADWGSSRVMYLQDIGMGVLQSRLLMRVPQVTSFFETAAGELRLVSMSGDIYELSDRPARKTKAGSDITGGTAPPTDAVLLEEKSRDPAVVRSGRKLFGNGCHLCHGANGEGAIGPNLRDETWLKGSRMVDIVNSIAVGSAYGGMPAWNEILSPLEIEALAAFVTSLGGVQGQGTAPKPNPN